MQQSEHINELAAALAKAQGQMQPAKMEATNPFLKNKYADLGSVIQASRAALSANGLSFTQHPAIEDGRVSITTSLMHASGQWQTSTISLPIGEEKGLSLAQSMGKVVTYLRRYSLSAILGIYADEDTDGNDLRPAKPAQPKPTTVHAAYQSAVQALDQVEAEIKSPRQPVPTFIMDRAEAEAERASDGTPYGEIDSADLEGRLHGIAKGLNKPGLTVEQKEQYKRKSMAISVILQARAEEDEAARQAMNEGE
jgi:hypothetical protein